MKSHMNNEELRNSLEQFKKASLVLKEKLVKDEYQALEQLMDERQCIIDDMNAAGFNHADFKNICHELGIIQLDAEISSLMENSKEETRQKILELKSRKVASRSYNEGFYGKAHFLNKKL